MAFSISIFSSSLALIYCWRGSSLIPDFSLAAFMAAIYNSLFLVIIIFLKVRKLSQRRTCWNIFLSFFYLSPLMRTNSRVFSVIPVSLMMDSRRQEHNPTKP